MNKFVKEYLPYIIIIIVVVLIRSYVVTPVIVNGSSMETTLSSNDMMLLNKMDKVDRFEIVVLNYNNDKLIKRVIALPGEYVECIDGIVYVNGNDIGDTYGSNKTEDFKRVYLSNNEYFVMGDNRGDSLDSRFIGAIKSNQIMGTVDLRLFPFNKIGKVK